MFVVLKFTNNLMLINNYKSNTSNFIVHYLNFINDSYYTYENFTNYYFKLVNFVIFILKKEKKYTKLKYSRVPQVDIVSGGVASLLAGLLGFLVTEKVGFELIDSGDFYVLIIYLTIVVNSIRIVYKTLII